MAALNGTIDCVANLQRPRPSCMKNFDDIENITTEHSKAAFEYGGWIALPDKSLTTTSAQTSVQYAAPTQLADGQVLMAQFSVEKLNRPLLKELMAKIVPTHNTELVNVEGKGLNWRTNMTVKFQGGEELRECVKAPRGIEPTASNEDIMNKWRRLVDGILNLEKQEKFEECFLALDKLADIRELSELLAGTLKSPIRVWKNHMALFVKC